MKNRRKGVSLKVGNNFYQEFFLNILKVVQECHSFFHLYNWDNEGDWE